MGVQRIGLIGDGENAAADEQPQAVGQVAGVDSVDVGEIGDAFDEDVRGRELMRHGAPMRGFVQVDAQQLMTPPEVAARGRGADWIRRRPGCRRGGRKTPGPRAPPLRR